jgi:hypothetical protein
MVYLISLLVIITVAIFFGWLVVWLVGRRRCMSKDGRVIRLIGAKLFEAPVYPVVPIVVVVVVECLYFELLVFYYYFFIFFYYIIYLLRCIFLLFTVYNNKTVKYNFIYLFIYFYTTYFKK